MAMMVRMMVMMMAMMMMVVMMNNVGVTSSLIVAHLTLVDEPTDYIPINV